MDKDIQFYQDVNTRLTGLGFVEADKDQVDYYSRLVLDEILSNLNLPELPKPLYSVYVDMVCGEILNTLFITGKLDDLFPNKITKEDVTSINAGDTSYSINAGTSKRTQIEQLINSLRNPTDRTYLFDCFRDFIR